MSLIAVMRSVALELTCVDSQMLCTISFAGSHSDATVDEKDNLAAASASQECWQAISSIGKFTDGTSEDHWYIAAIISSHERPAVFRPILKGRQTYMGTPPKSKHTQIPAI
ncbi:hypothetical protein C7974DRAFT_400727 [Boeremia exigua]|uniref:uncharacterized protein n=1 Tax=Boeremia exigua TaxID=749465 RepID=UPI001E8E458E|nr:uncharacterized protein C7974DRAFT_400727 [Boeremia exigua]KAH6618731.1 hypothetical protein C7974DRAFT_400727 [Boeremia exigua]